MAVTVRLMHPRDQSERSVTRNGHGVASDGSCL